MKKRVLWLLNHTTLRGYEVPLLIDLGYEVYCPKICQREFGDLSASISYEFDASLSIPPEILEKLNKTDFYSLRVPQEIATIMNEYFDIAICAAFPELIEMLIRQFKGVIVLRVFGLDRSSNYTQVLFSALGEHVFRELQQLGRRFWFGAGYENLGEIEGNFFQKRFLHLPIGMKNTTIQNNWVGEDRRILFVCPRINSNPYYRNLYEKFKKDFPDIPYAIGGAQIVPVHGDPHILGFVSDEEYRYNMTHMAAMYYHSQEPRHIHFHPFEAIRNGMPLVFMGGGLLDSFGGRALVGRCETVAEARKKLKRLSNGDHALAEKIISSQSILIEPFQDNNCRNIWAKSMERIERNIRVAPSYIHKKVVIGVVIPETYLGGVLDYSIRLAECIQRGAKDFGDNVEVIFAHLDAERYQDKDCFKRLDELGISIRTYQWKKKTADWAARTYELEGMPVPNVDEIYVPEDDCGSFRDCDYLIFTADRLPGHVFLHQRYAVVAHDYIQRYVPGMFGGYYEKPIIQGSRQADAVFVTTPATYQDAMQYAGIARERLFLTPLMFDLVEAPVDNKACLTQGGEKRHKKAVPYFLWATNLAMHKNHKRALLALSEYYQRGGALDCFVTGVDTELFDPDTELHDGDPRGTYQLLECRKLVDRDPALRRHISFHGSLPMQQYLRLLSKAKFVFHPGYGDNGTGTVVDGACLGVPTVCSDYPAMRDLLRIAGIDAHFFNPFDVRSIYGVLEEAEQNAEKYRLQLPSRERLEKCTVEGVYKKLYTTVRTVVGGF